MVSRRRLSCLPAPIGFAGAIHERLSDPARFRDDERCSRTAVHHLLCLTLIARANPGARVGILVGGKVMRRREMVPDTFILSANRHDISRRL